MESIIGQALPYIKELLPYLLVNFGATVICIALPAFARIHSESKINIVSEKHNFFKKHRQDLFAVLICINLTAFYDISKLFPKAQVSSWGVWAIILSTLLTALIIALSSLHTYSTDLTLKTEAKNNYNNRIVLCPTSKNFRVVVTNKSDSNETLQQGLYAKLKLRDIGSDTFRLVVEISQNTTLQIIVFVVCFILAILGELITIHSQLELAKRLAEASV